MNELVNNGIIREITSGNNFEYVVSSQATFMDTDYKVLQSQSNDIFVKCMKILRNGQISLCYLCNDYRTLEGMKNGLTADTAMAVTARLLGAITNVKTNGFLSCQSILLEPEKIFVDNNTKKVRLVYLPISEKLFASGTDFDEALRNTLEELLNSVTVGRNGRLEALLQDVLDRSIPFDIIYQRCRDVVPETKTATEPQPITSGTVSNTGALGSICLEALNAPYPFEIRITEDDVLIGKKAELVDKVIDFNNAISRRHCRVVKQNGCFFIIDEGSANGTYVNNVRIAPQVMAPIKSGDLVRLANSDFRVK